MNVRIPVRCPAEVRVIGEVVVERGACVDERTFRAGYEPFEGYALDPSAVHDGTQLLCPRCGNPLAFWADGTDFHAVPGTIRIAAEGASCGAQAG